MFQPGQNDALTQNFMKLGLLVAEKNVDTQTNQQDSDDSCFISIDRLKFEKKNPKKYTFEKNIGF